MEDPITATANFLHRLPLYSTEKPYTLRFTPPAPFPRANISLSTHFIRIHNIRGPFTRPNTSSVHISTPTLPTHGFALLPFHTSLPYASFDDDTLVKSVYLREVANFLLKNVFGNEGARKVQIFEHTVRKRHGEFPISTGEPYRWNQPTSIAHVDTTVGWAVGMAGRLNGGEGVRDGQESGGDSDGNEDSHMDRDWKYHEGKGRVVCVNFWKPLRGPVRDWPLALCNPATIDVEEDLEPCDLVYPDYVVENRQVYFRDGQEWWWCKDQTEDEAWVFMQSDTHDSTKPVAHTAFELEGVEGEPRESIEVRALVYFDDVGGDSNDSD